MKSRNPVSLGACHCTLELTAYGKSMYHTTKTTHVSQCYHSSVTGNVMRVSRSTQAVSWLRRKPAFDPRTVRMEFIVGKMVFSDYVGCALGSIMPILLHTHISLTYQRRYMIFASDSRVTTQKSDDFIYTAAKARDHADRRHYIHTHRKGQMFHPMYHNPWTYLLSSKKITQQTGKVLAVQRSHVVRLFDEHTAKHTGVSRTG